MSPLPLRMLEDARGTQVEMRWNVLLGKVIVSKEETLKQT